MSFIIAVAILCATPDVEILSAHVEGCAACKIDEPKLDSARRMFLVTDLTEKQSIRREVKRYPTYIVLKDRKEVFRGGNINEAIKHATFAAKERPSQQSPRSH